MSYFPIGSERERTTVIVDRDTTSRRCHYDPGTVVHRRDRRTGESYKVIANEDGCLVRESEASDEARRKASCRYRPGTRVTNHRDGTVSVADEDGCLVIDDALTSELEERQAEREGGGGSGSRGDGMSAGTPDGMPDDMPEGGFQLPGAGGGGGIPPIVMWGGAAAGAGVLIMLLLRR